MIKKIIAILFMVLVSLLVVMGVKEYKAVREDNELKEQNKPEEKDEIIIWYSYEEYGEYLKYVADTYKTASGIDVVIKYISASEQGDMIDAIAEANGNAGQMPDLYITNSQNLEELYLLGLCKENTNNKVNEDNYSKAALESITYKDKYYAYPLGFEMSAFVYNKKYVTSVPSTFDDIKLYAENFNDLGENDSSEESGEETNAGTEEGTETEEIVDYSVVEDIIVWDANYMKSNYGFIGKYIDFKGTYSAKDEEIDVDEEKFSSAILYYKELYDYFSLESKATGTEEENYQQIVSDFSEGKIVFTILNIKSLKELDGLGVEYGVCPLPQLSSTLGTCPLSETDIVVVNPYSSDVTRAEEFASYLTFNISFKLYDITGLLPAKKMKTYDNDALMEIANEYAYSTGFPKLIRLSDYWLKIENLFKSVNAATTETIIPDEGAEDEEIIIDNSAVEEIISDFLVNLN